MVVEQVEHVDLRVFKVHQVFVLSINNIRLVKTVTSALDVVVDILTSVVDGVVDVTVTRVDVHRVIVLTLVEEQSTIHVQVLLLVKVETVELEEDTITSQVH